MTTPATTPPWRLMPIAIGLLSTFAAALSAQTPTAPTVLPSDPPSTEAVASEATAFVTKYARFQPVAFETLPGWSTDSVRESLDVFSRSCKVLARKSAWSHACSQLGQADARSDDGARQFFETHFQVYQVMNPDATTSGRITGYYEPELEGRSARDARFRFPVYGAPSDLYQLDARSLSGASRQWFRIEGNRLLAAAPGTDGARDYALLLGEDLPGMADKRYRVRIEGESIVPYFNRQQIEAHGIEAPVLAWVQDAYALYSMQVQGSGKIRLPGGTMIRLAYADQNGQPFLPNATASDTAVVTSAIKTRGLRLGAASAADAAAGAPTDEVSTIIARLSAEGGSRPPAASHVSPAAVPAPAPTVKPVRTGADRRNAEAGDAQVQAIIAKLSQSPTASPAPPSRVEASPMPVPASTTTPKADDPQVQAMIAQLLGKAPPSAGTGSLRPRRDESRVGSSQISGVDAARLAVDPGRTGAAKHIAPGVGIGAGATSGIGDPSYVFFRVIPDGPQGPTGALGVPLTAGRSLAVDPRTTPLGAPVFVTTPGPGGRGSIDRLMFAQDTGGAIRGSVRGDFFWGYGDDAGSLAASMNANGRMWLLLPKGLTLGALAPKVRTRSLGSIAQAPDCVIPDEDSCVED